MKAEDSELYDDNSLIEINNKEYNLKQLNESKEIKEDEENDKDNDELGKKYYQKNII